MLTVVSFLLGDVARFAEVILLELVLGFVEEDTFGVGVVVDARLIVVALTLVLVFGTVDFEVVPFLVVVTEAVPAAFPLRLMIRFGSSSRQRQTFVISFKESRERPCGISWELRRVRGFLLFGRCSTYPSNHVWQKSDAFLTPARNVTAASLLVSQPMIKISVCQCLASRLMLTS